MTSRRRTKTLRRTTPTTRFPVTRRLIALANALGSTRLHEIADQVRELEADANALRASLTRIEVKP